MTLPYNSLFVLLYYQFSTCRTKMMNKRQNGNHLVEQTRSQSGQYRKNKSIIDRASQQTLTY